MTAEYTVVSSSIDKLAEQNLEKVNLGQHVLAEFFECDPNVLNNSDKVRYATACLLKSS